MKKKYTFLQFIAATEFADNFDEITNEDIQMAENFLNNLFKSIKEQPHCGDCTNESKSCPHCVFQFMLKDYKEYYFNTEEWMEENV